MTERDFRVKKGLKVEGGDVVVSSSYKVDTPTLDVTTINLGNADTTLVRSGAGDASIEGNVIYRAGGTTVPISDGGTGATSASAARTALGLVKGISNGNVLQANAAVADDDFLRIDGTSVEGRSATEVKSDLGLGDAAEKTVGIGTGNVFVAAAGVADDDFLRIDGTTVEGRSATEVRSDLGLGTSAVKDVGIGDGNVLSSNANVVDNDFLRIDGTSVEGRNVSEVKSDLGLGNAAEKTVGVGTGNVFVAAANIADDDFLRVDGTSVEGRSATEVKSDLGLGDAAEKTVGIGNGNVLVANANVADDDFLRVDGTSIEGRTAAEVRSDLSLGDAALKTVGVGNGNVLTAVSAGLSNNEFLKVDGSAIESRNTLEMRSDLGIGAVGLVDTITTSHITASVLVTAAEGIGSNSADDKIATTAAVKAYADGVSGGTVAGSNTQIQFNNSGSFGASANLTFASNKLKIGSATSNEDALGDLHIISTAPKLTIEEDDDGSGIGPIINLYRHSDSAADDDILGVVQYRGVTDNNTNVTYGKVRAEIKDASDGAKAGRLVLSGLHNNSQADWLTIDGTTAAFSGAVTVAGNTTITGNLTVDGTTTTVNSTTLVVDDKNIELAHSPSGSEGDDAAVDGGGITLKSSDSDKTFNWVDSTDSWTSSEHMDLASGKVFKINETSVLSATTLGSGVTASSLTSVGTLTTLTVDNVRINGTQIGHTSDTDLITLASGVVTVAGEVSMTTLDIGGTNVTSTANELNFLDGCGAGQVVNSKAAIYSSAGELAATTVDINSAVITDAFKQDSPQNWAASAQDLDSFSATAYRGAKVLIQMHDDSNGHYEIVEMNVTHNGSTAYYSVYGQVSTHTADLGTYSATLASNTIKIQFTPATGGDNWKYSIKMEYFDVQ